MELVSATFSFGRIPHDSRSGLGSRSVRVSFLMRADSGFSTLFPLRSTEVSSLGLVVLRQYPESISFPPPSSSAGPLRHSGVSVVSTMPAGGISSMVSSSRFVTAMLFGARLLPVGEPPDPFPALASRSSFVDPRLFFFTRFRSRECFDTPM